MAASSPRNWHLYLFSSALLLLGFARAQNYIYQTIAEAYADTATHGYQTLGQYSPNYVGTTVPEVLWLDRTAFNTTSLATYLTLYPSYDFATTNFTGQSPDVVPDVVNIGMGYCGVQNGLTYVNATPAGCAKGLLLYGWDSIPSRFTYPYLVTDQTINGGQYGMQQYFFNTWEDGSPAIDTGYPQQLAGNIAWIRPTDGSCPKINSNFQVTLQTQGYYNAAVTNGGNSYDFVPTSVFQNYSTNATAQYKYPGVYGLECSLAPRSPGSAIVSFAPTLVAICRNNLPYNYTLYGSTTSQYQTLAGKSGFRGPINVPQGAIVYMLIGNTIPAPTSVYANVKFTYITGTNAANFTAGPFYSNNGYVTYIVGNSQPGFVSTQFFSPYNGFTQAYNEAQLYQLQACNCGTSPNIMCNATDGGNEYNLNVGPYIPIRTVPNYSVVPNFTQGVSCAIQPNVADSLSVFAGVLFGATSTYSPNSIPIQSYSWSLLNLPASAGLIFTPTAQTTGVVIFAAVTVTLQLVITTTASPTGFINCTSTFPVLNAAPIININPSSTEITITSGTMQSFDAHGSVSPDLSPLRYFWQVLFGPVVQDYTLASTNGSTTAFSAISTNPEAVTYVLQLTVTNDVTSTSQQINIFVVQAGIPYIYAPVQAGPGFEPIGPCVQPSPPFAIVVPPAEPFYWIPFNTQPGTSPLPPSQFQPLGAPGGFLPPNQYITPTAQTNIISIIVVVIFVVVFASVACIFGKQTTSHLRPD